uniref:Uncharacterized protein n=1 Tax=Strongyloides stercoralis TaxID=6248 RepID=A0AAF5DPG8_STRER
IFMNFLKANFLLFFILFLGVAASFYLDSIDLNKIILDNSVVQNDLSIDLDNQQLLKNNHIRNDTMEFLTREKRQLAAFLNLFKKLGNHHKVKSIPRRLHKQKQLRRQKKLTTKVAKITKRQQTTATNAKTFTTRTLSKPTTVQDRDAEIIEKNYKITFFSKKKHMLYITGDNNFYLLFHDLYVEKNFLFVFVLFFGNTISFDYEYGDYEIISDDTTKENDLPIDLNNEELSKNKHFKNDTMEFFTRTKRQSAIFEKTLKQSGFKNQQKDQLEKDSLNNVEKPIKKARRQKTTTKVPEFITTNILSESSIVQKENIKMPIDDYDEYFAKFKADHMNNLKRGTNATKTTQNINEASGEDVFSTSTGNENLENEDRGRPCFTVDNDELRAIVEADLRQTVGKLAEALNLDKWIPHELNDYQKNRRFEICSSLILRNKNDSFLD